MFDADIDHLAGDRIQLLDLRYRLHHIALDHTPIGDFAEFEGDGAEKVAKRCKFDPETAERRNYLQIYQDYRAEHPEAPADMIFP